LFGGGGNTDRYMDLKKHALALKFSRKLWRKKNITEKSRTQETLNLESDADSITIAIEIFADFF
jgi:hypothetical protein